MEKSPRRNNRLKNRNILILGAGIAGPCLAYWLKLYGFNPTVVERSPKLREGGYAIDVRSSGAEVAKKMGLWEAIEARDTNLSRLAFVDQNAKTVHQVNMKPLISYLHRNASWIELMRTDLSKMLFKSSKGVIYIFGDSIQSLKEDSSGINIEFQSGLQRRFDIVVGADGLHSVVRSLTFGPETQFEYYCGYYIGVGTIDNFLKLNHTHELYSIPGKSIDLYSNRDRNKAIAFFMFSKKTRLHFDCHKPEEQKQLLAAEFGDIKTWDVKKILEKVMQASDFFFDSVSQIRMPTWSKGRIVLLGDAAFAPSFLTGQGTQLAMKAAYELATALKEENGDYKRAFKKYEATLRPEVKNIQKNIRFVGEIIIPRSSTIIWLRNHLVPTFIRILTPLARLSMRSRSGS